MKIRLNHNNNNLYCIYSKEKIEIDEKYVEVIDICLDEEIVKTYKYDYLDLLIDEYLENYDQEPELNEEY